jgi:hypothetical protein
VSVWLPRPATCAVLCRVPTREPMPMPA